MRTTRSFSHESTPRRRQWIQNSRENHRPTPLTNTPARILTQNVSWSNPTTSLSECGLSQERKVSFTLKNSNHVIHHKNKLKKKYHIVITVNATKIPDKIQHPFLIKH